MVKVGVIGSNGNLFKALKLLIETQNQNVELVEVTQDQIDEDNQKVAIIGDPIITDFKPTTKHNGGKSGRNKSDRKRNRKNRWG